MGEHDRLPMRRASGSIRVKGPVCLFLMGATLAAHVRRRFWVEAVLAAVIGVMAVSTAVWPSWFEAFSGMAPDNGDGSLEWMITLGLAATATASALIARWEWCRQPLDGS